MKKRVAISLILLFILGLINCRSAKDPFVTADSLYPTYTKNEKKSEAKYNYNVYTIEGIPKEIGQVGMYGFYTLLLRKTDYN